MEINHQCACESIVAGLSYNKTLVAREVPLNIWSVPIIKCITLGIQLTY